MKPIKVFLIDDHPVVHMGLAQALSDLEDIDVVGVAESAPEALSRLQDVDPEVVLVDLSMPGMSGLEATRQIRQTKPGTKVVIFSMHDEQSFINQAFQAGALGYVLKGAAVSEVATALRTASKGEYFLCARLQKVVVRDFFHVRETTPEEQSYEQLTDREQQILRLLVNGYSTTEIGKMLFISPKTVESHRANIMQKLGVDNLVALIKYCMRINILDPQEWKE